MNGEPKASESFCAITRAAMSVPPPAAKPTTMRTGFAGYFCAPAGAAATAAHRPATAINM
ncbi:hypothetical protein D3C83_133080 [compost metagenome]